MWKNNIFWLLVIIILGLSIRLFLASFPYNPHNNDMRNILTMVNLLRDGKNIYVSIGRDNFGYNTGPGWLILINFIRLFQEFLPFLSIPFLIRSFLSLVDLLSLFVLISIARLKKISVLPVACLFFLNPISMIISGYHGQFDNIAILFLLLGMLVYEKKNIFNKVKTVLVWFLLTIGLIVKHTIFMQAFILFLYLTKNIFKTGALFTSTILTFFLSFLPFVGEYFFNTMRIIMTYSGVPVIYGVTSVMYFFYSLFFDPQNICYGCNPAGLNVNFSTLFAILTYTFILFYFLFTFYISSREKDLGRSFLVSFLFFLTFTPGIGAYFIWPVALGALYPSFWFVLYTLVVFLYYLGSSYVFNISFFSWVPLNLIWVVVIIWFVSKVKKLKYEKSFP